MPRHMVVLEGAYGIVEDMLYAAADAEDFVTRERPNFLEYIEAVADGKISAAEAKRRINEAFANALKQIEEARGLAAANGRRMGFSHLHESLRETPSEIVPALAFRVVVPLPGGETA